MMHIMANVVAGNPWKLTTDVEEGKYMLSIQVSGGTVLLCGITIPQLEMLKNLEVPSTGGAVASGSKFEAIKLFADDLTCL